MIELIDKCTFPENKEKVMKIEEASILNRSNRKYWYIKYQTFIDNKIVTKEESTKVLKDEKTLKYMQTKFLPAWIAKKANQSNIFRHKNILFMHYAEIFLFDCTKLHDYKNHEYRVQRILKDFGKLDIRKITKLQVKLWINKLIDERSKKELSRNSKIKYLGNFRGIFQQALDDNVVKSNFINEIRLPGAKRNLNDIKPFDKEEVNLLLKKSKDRNYGNLMHEYLGIAFNLGMSPSEILGLQIEDIDLGNKTVSIKRNVTKGKIKETKNGYRTREIPLFDSATPYVTSLLEGAQEKGSVWLFSDEHGNVLYDIKNIRGKRASRDAKAIKTDTKWYKLLKDCCLEFRNLKNTRHTFAVTAIESKSFTMQEIANILGHGSLKMLNEHYAKWTQGKALGADRSIKLFSDTYGDTSKN
jgi:integrase